MTQPSIIVESIGKSYVIGANRFSRRPGQETLIDSLANKVRQLLNKSHKSTGASGEDAIFHALQDINITVHPGEKVAIIGHNGAGKSTLLKLLSRITEPTHGRMELNGRVSSLLEVGTGFHPELTGRENIFLNGAILGLTRGEVKAKFDEILDFSECAQFIDTPIKRYSSGMKVRLAFAVAAHLEPEILIVDEVLAVGDVAFQNKCLGKMQEVSHDEKRTVLFVSHNMMAVEALCERGIVLEHGRVVFDGSTREAVHQYYLSSIAASNQKQDKNVETEHYDEESDIGFRNVRASLDITPEREMTLSIELDAFSQKGRTNIGVGVEIQTAHGHLVASLAPKLTNFTLARVGQNNHCIFTCREITRHLAAGEYVVSAWLSIPRVRVLIRREHVCSFTIPPQDPFGAGVGNDYNTYGVVVLPMEFEAGEGAAEP